MCGFGRPKQPAHSHHSHALPHPAFPSPPEESGWSIQRLSLRQGSRSDTYLRNLDSLPNACLCDKDHGGIWVVFPAPAFATRITACCSPEESGWSSQRLSLRQGSRSGAPPQPAGSAPGRGRWEGTLGPPEFCHAHSWPCALAPWPRAPWPPAITNHQLIIIYIIIIILIINNK